MTPSLTSPLHRSWRFARVVAVALALAVASVSSSGAAAHDRSEAAPATTTSTAQAPCLTKASGQRVRADSDLDGVDPNDLTPAQTRSAERSVDTRFRQRRLGTARTSPPSTRIDVYVHVITRTNGKGGVSKKRIAQQIAVLNKAYGGGTTRSATPTPFTFRLKHIDKTAKTAWYHWAPPTQRSLGDDVGPKTKLHRGGPDDLNLYVASLDGGVLGYSSFPWDTTLVRDGVVVLDASLPGGAAKGYDRGDTATHEVGHWLGLLHTFENGCEAPGDLVDDTPDQADGPNIFSCDAALDSCPAGAGRDPVHNFMSYGDDRCLNRFTPGQVARMVAVWQAYRAPGAAG